MVKNKSIKDQDSNRKWVHEIGTRIKVINEPPTEKIYIDYILISEYLIGSKYRRDKRSCYAGKTSLLVLLTWLLPLTTP